ncbi:hypothetical protein LCGC14_2385860 [marine sediment metagenome]|uniref:Uncharacterized protein n=1 Tax=marine sediment metagenome TaxID=412755 RepID=A0A0F9EBZ3_9ZZZZ
MDIEVEIAKWRKSPDVEDYVPETLQFIIHGERGDIALFIELSATEARKMAQELNDHAAMVEEAEKSN